LKTRSTAGHQEVGRVVRFAGRRARRAATAAILAAAAATCAPAGRAGDRAAQRIVSLAPSITELLFAIGAGDRVVGRTTWCDYPPEARRIASVGDGLNPNVEAIVARRPDLVLVYTAPSNAAAAARLRALGIAVDTIRMDRLADVVTGARRFGRLTGTMARADSIAAAFATTLDSARAAPVKGPHPRVLLLAWDAPPVVIGGGSFQHELVTLAGADNVFADLAQASGQVSIETIAARDPDLIILLGETAPQPAWAARPEWQAVRAVRERRFVRLTGSEFARPSFRALAAARTLRTAIQEAGR
jgi:ABC-type Fe3+-hydroxamate transport system substrate-binding protein